MVLVVVELRGTEVVVNGGSFVFRPTDEVQADKNNNITQPPTAVFISALRQVANDPTAPSAHVGCDFSDNSRSCVIEERRYLAVTSLTVPDAA